MDCGGGGGGGSDTEDGNCNSTCSYSCPSLNHILEVGLLVNTWPSRSEKRVLIKDQSNIKIQPF